MIFVFIAGFFFGIAFFSVASYLLVWNYERICRRERLEDGDN